MASVVQTDQKESEFGTDTATVAGEIRTRRLTYTGLGLLLGALMGFGIGWLAFEGGDAVDLPTDVDELLVEYRDAWIAGDGDAAVALMSTGGVHVSPYTGPGGVSGDELARAIGSNPLALTDPETLAAWGDLPYIVVQADELWEQMGYSVFEIEQELGELKIASQVVYFLPPDS